jgi:peptidylprolyl isomerase domain and WD repeat-containing protein 1
VVKRRRTKLPASYFRVHEQRLPSAQMYERSYMHRAEVTHLVVTKTHFLATGSRDGYLKFWQKIAGGLEFVKQWRPHLAAITGMSASADGFLLATVSTDKAVKIFDVINFGQSRCRALISKRLRVQT